VDVVAPGVGVRVGGCIAAMVGNGPKWEFRTELSGALLRKESNRKMFSRREDFVKASLVLYSLVASNEALSPCHPTICRPTLLHLVAAILHNGLDVLLAPQTGLPGLFGILCEWQMDPVACSEGGQRKHTQRHIVQ